MIVPKKPILKYFGVPIQDAFDEARNNTPNSLYHNLFDIFYPSPPQEIHHSLPNSFLKPALMLFHLYHGCLFSALLYSEVLFCGST